MYLQKKIIIVSIPQAVGAVATKLGYPNSCKYLDAVSIPQAVGAVATNMIYFTTFL